MEKLNELALFAGAGGSLLASKLLGWRTIAAVEYGEHQRKCLMQRQNDGAIDPFPIWDDIRTFDGSPFEGTVDIVTGGFPCQAFSTAAAGKNNADDLWPEMRRVVADVAPRFVYAENVSPKAINAAADDLQSMGYKTKAIALSAKDMGGDHIRNRNWLLAYTDDTRELLRGLNAKAQKLHGLAHSVWESDPTSSRVPDGVASRMERLRASGNGQVPIVAVCALILLCQ